MKKTWIEKRMYTSNEQIALIQPNETMDGVILNTIEINEKGDEARLYLTYQEAKDLANHLLIFVSENEK